MAEPLDIGDPRVQQLQVALNKYVDFYRRDGSILSSGLAPALVGAGISSEDLDSTIAVIAAAAGDEPPAKKARINGRRQLTNEEKADKLLATMRSDIARINQQTAEGVNTLTHNTAVDLASASLPEGDLTQDVYNERMALFRTGGEHAAVQQKVSPCLLCSLAC